MNAPLPRDSKTLPLAVASAMLVVGVISVPMVSVADSTVSVDSVVAAGSYVAYTVPVQNGETVSVDITTRSGPPLDFFFVTQSGFIQFNASWPATNSFTYLQELSSTNATAIQKTATVPADGTYHLIIANSDATMSSSAVGSIRTTAQFPPLLIVVAIILICVGAVAAVAATIMVRRSYRSRLAQYAPPSRPTPPTQIHQHIPAQRPVLQQEIGQQCPKCSYKNAQGTTVCGKCGSRL